MGNLSKHLKKQPNRSSNYRAEFIQKEKADKRKTITYIVVPLICIILLLCINYRTWAIPFKNYQPVVAVVENGYKEAVPEHTSYLYSADLSFEVDGITYSVTDKLMPHAYGGGESVTIYYNSKHPMDTKPTSTEIMMRLLFSSIPFVLTVVLLPEGIKRLRNKKRES